MFLVNFLEYTLITCEILYLIVIQTEYLSAVAIKIFFFGGGAQRG